MITYDCLLKTFGLQSIHLSSYECLTIINPSSPTLVIGDPGCRFFPMIQARKTANLDSRLQTSPVR